MFHSISISPVNSYLAADLSFGDRLGEFFARMQQGFDAIQPFGAYILAIVVFFAGR